ncbi:hypothetical protein KFL_002860160 [Klebsormidium nitens]|uniref:SAM domain-containing protein n=1 Tax=Klebsormidium nitens TaxID=105231 RepID=A0A1Y1I8W6_KLENI|nr:hypothetical protein KFL_002860160 [Klebsormidium nitens]|eukprot:GAQ86392.1 hypothetical protein KFL_002860160 [Klebsormidium nitens]
MDAFSERRRVPPLNLNPKPLPEEIEVDLRLNSIMRGMGDSEPAHQTVSGNVKRPSSASRRGVTPGFDDEHEILSRLDSIIRTADGSGRSTPAMSERGLPAAGRDSVKQTPDGLGPIKQTPAGGNTVRQFPDERDSARQTPDGRNSVRETPDGGDSFRQTPDGDFLARQTRDGRTSTRQTADQRDSARQTPDGRYPVNQTSEGGNSPRQTPNYRNSAPDGGSSFRKAPDGRDSARQTDDIADAIRAKDLEKNTEGSGRLTPAHKAETGVPFGGVSVKQTPEPVAVERQASHRELQAERGIFGAPESGRSSPALTDRSAVETRQASARQSPVPAAINKPEGMLHSVKSIVRGIENGVREEGEKPSQPAQGPLAFGDRSGLSMDNPMFDLEEIEDVEVSSPKMVGVKGFRGETPRTPAEVETPGRGSAGQTSGGRTSNTTPLPSGRANGTPRSGSPQVTSARQLMTSASLASDEEVFSRLDSIVRSVGEPGSAAHSRPASARMGPREEPEEIDEMEEELPSDAEKEWTTQKATAGGRPSSALPSRKSTPQMSARSEQSPVSSRPASARKPSDAAAKTASSQQAKNRPSADVSHRSNDVTPRQESEGVWSPPVVRRPSGALGNYPPADDYADDFEGGAEEEIVEDDGPETPEDQAPPRVLNRSVQEIPRENADASGSEAALPVRNFGPRPASAYGPRGTSSSAGNFVRSWGATPSDASTSGSRDEVPDRGVDSEGMGRGGVVTSSAFANGFDNRPWSAGSAPGMGLHSGSLDGDFDRRSVDLGPVRLAKTGSFGSRGGSKGSGMSKDEFRVHFENAEPADSEPSLSQASFSPSKPYASSSRPTSASAGPRAREIARTLEMHPTQWGVAEVCHWIEHIGHGQHRVRFAHHRIDGPLLLRLTEEQLKSDLDIRSLGQRQSIATQIGALRESLGLASQRRSSSPKRPSSAPRMRASGDLTSSSATLREEERRSKLARELEKAQMRATKARMKAEVLTYTVGQAESEVERLHAELAELERREQKRAAAAGKQLPLWRPPGEHIASLGGSSVASSDYGTWFKPQINPKSLEMLQSTEGSSDFLQRMTSDLTQRAQKVREKRQQIALGWRGGYEFLEQQKHKTEQFLKEVLQQKLDVSVEELTDTVVDTLLDEHGGALDLTDDQQENLARARGSKRRILLEQYLRGNEFMSRLENDQRRRDASLREYRAHLEMIDTISRNGKTRDQREQDDRRAAAAHFKELWPAWEMPPAGSGSGSGNGSGNPAAGAKPDEATEEPDSASNSLLDSLLEQALTQKQNLAKYAIVQQNEIRRGLGLVLFEGEPMEARASSSVGQYGASNGRGNQSPAARPQTAGRAREEKGGGEGKVPIMQETLWMISRLKADEIKRLQQARGEKKVMAVYRAFRAQQFVRKMEFDKEVRDFKLEQKLSELRRRPKSAGNAREFMMRLEDDLQKRKEKEQALVKQRILTEGPSAVPPPKQANWRS